MPHDQHAAALHHQIADRRSDDAAFNLAALFHTAGNAPVERKALRAFYGSLISAAPQRHIQRLCSHRLALAQGLRKTAHTDGKGHRTGLVPDGARRIQHGKAPLYQLLHVALFHHGNILRSADAPQKARCASDKAL